MNCRIMETFRKIKNKFKYGTVLYFISSNLSRVGLTIEPYYLEQELLHDEGELKVNVKPRLDSCTVGFLDEDTIRTFMTAPERINADEGYKIDQRLADGCVCFGVKHKDEIAAYTWCSLKRCTDEKLTFPLKENEAYLFDAYTFKKYRGKNLAPYMRYQLYKYLVAKGRNIFYSVTLLYNTPSIKFKSKLNAKHLKLYLYICLFEKFNWFFLLRTYS